MKIEVLCENPWLELRQMSDPSQGVGGYVYSHEKRCNGKIISILPFRHEEDGSISFLLRKEVTPCWGMDPAVSSITGGYEGGDMLDDVIRELKEEGGYDISKGEIIDLGTSRGTKSTDTTYYYFSADLTGKERGSASGDGSELEAKAECFWSPSIDGAMDPLVYVSHYKLLSKMKSSKASTDKNYEGAVRNMRRFLNGQEDLDPKMAKVLTQNFWNLI